MTLTRNMKIGIKKIVTYKVDEIRAKKFYDRIMSEDKPVATLKQLMELRGSFVFTNLSVGYCEDRSNITAVMDFKNIKVVLDE